MTNKVYSFRIFILFGVLVLTTLSVQAQQSYSISAKVVDDKDSVLFGNLLALTTADSSLISGTFFADGMAELTGINDDAVLIKFTSLGFADTILKVERPLDGNLVDLGTLSMRSNDLTTFTVVASKPIFEQSPDGAMKINVQNTMLSSSGNALEVLAKSPGVQVTDDGVSVAGKGQALIYLNGKMIPFEMLSTIPVSSIEQVEVITNPSAKYDAQGRAVINIITVPNLAEGIQGTITQHTTMANSMLSTTMVALNYRKKKISLSGSYNMNLGKDWSNFSSQRSLESVTDTLYSDSDADQYLGQKLVSNYSIGLGVQISDKSDLSLEYNGAYNDYDIELYTLNSINSNSDDGILLDIDTEGDHQDQTHSLSLNYNIALDTLGSSLFVAGQYFLFDRSTQDNIDEKFFNGSSLLSSADRLNIGQAGITIATGQADFVKGFKNGSHLDIGTKYSTVENDGKVDFFSRQNDQEEFIQETIYSNDFVYQEDIMAGYFQYAGTIKNKISYNLGARGEYTEALGISNALNQRIIDTSYLNIFPNASLFSPLGDKYMLALTYSGRINRPKYQDLDPFLVYQDSVSSYRGNPSLVPELTHAFEGTLSYQMYSLTLGYNHSINPFRHAIISEFNGENNSFILTQINLDKLNSYFARLTVPFEKGKWTSYNSVSLTLDQFDDSRPEFSGNSISPEFYAFTYNKFLLGGGFDLELIGEYFGSKNDGVFSLEPTYTLSAAVGKGFFNNSLLVRFMANDIFHTYAAISSYKIGNASIAYHNRYNTQFFRLSLTWNFGKLQKMVYNNKASGEEETGRIK